jgi:hypothetical protein
MSDEFIRPRSFYIENEYIDHRLLLRLGWGGIFVKVSRNFAEKMLSIYDLFRNFPISIIFVKT